MTRRNRWLASIIVLAAALTVVVIATANGSTTRSYTTALIAKIGAGSDAVDRIVLLGNEGGIQGISHAPAYYNDHRWVSFLEQGDLAALTAKQLAHVLSDVKGDLVHAGLVSHQLTMLASQISAQTVPARLTKGLPNGSRQFVSEWNGYLSDAGRTVTGLRGVTGRIVVFIGDFATLTRKAKAVKAGGSLAPYKTALRRVQLDLRRINRLQALAMKPILNSRHWTTIVRLTRSDPDAGAIFRTVAEQYTSGVIPGPGRGYPFTVIHPA